MKIFIAHLFHESNTFAPGITDEERFATGAYCRGEEVREKYEGTRHYLGGMLDTAREHGAEVLFSISIGTAGPIISRKCLDYYVDQIIDDLENALPVDGLCLALHGAGVAEGIPDIEAYLLLKIRKIIGEKIPITASLDLHANLTSEMIRLTNGLFGLKTYPHVDTYETGSLAMQCLIRILKQSYHPVMTACRIPLLAAFTGMRTDKSSAAKSIQELIIRLKEEKKVFDITFLHGFCFADIPGAAMSVLIISDKKEEDLCRQITETVWQYREKMICPVITVEDALENALKTIQSDRLNIVVEGSDHGGAGGPNDGTFLLKALIDKNIPRSIFVSICDEEVAAECYEKGVGSHFSGYIGGKADNRHGSPVYVDNAVILGISTGHFRYTTPMYYGQPYCVGKTVRLKYRNVEIIINCVPRQTHDDRMIAITGSDIRFYQLICLKSGVAYRAFYETLPQFNLSYQCDPPGCSCPDLSTFKYSYAESFFPNVDITSPIFKLL